MNSLEKKSYEWFKEKIDKYQLKKNKDKEYLKMERRSIQPGSFITFDYLNPITKGKGLKFWDLHPCNVILGIRGKYMFCINFHYIHPKFRLTVIEYILKINKININQDKRLEVTYQLINEFMKRNGLEIAYHKYIIPRVSNLKYIKLSEVHHIVNLPTEKFNILDPNMSKDDLYRMIASHAKKTRSSKNTRFGR